MKRNQFTHLSSDNQPKMVDIGHKEASSRTAHASTIVVIPPEIISALDNGDIQSPKGPVFQTAIIAGTIACKKTSELIPFCHPIGLEDCKIEINVNAKKEIVIDCFVSVHHKTGVEMEALTGVSVAALTVYDMCKGLSHEIVITETRLIEKRGGKSDYTRDKGFTTEGY